MTAIELNPATPLDLRARIREPWNLLITMIGVDWSGPATCAVRSGSSVTSPLVASPTVAVARVGENTTFTLALTRAVSADVPIGFYTIDVRSDTGEVRAAGYISVQDSVTS